MNVKLFGLFYLLLSNMFRQYESHHGFLNNSLMIIKDILIKIKAVQTFKIKLTN
jgi:hypothetical protein